MDINNLKKEYIKKISKNIETINKQFNLLNNLDLQFINDNLQYGGSDIDEIKNRIHEKLRIIDKEVNEFIDDVNKKVYILSNSNKQPFEEMKKMRDTLYENIINNSSNYVEFDKKVTSMLQKSRLHGNIMNIMKDLKTDIENLKADIKEKELQNNNKIIPFENAIKQETQNSQSTEQSKTTVVSNLKDNLATPIALNLLHVTERELKEN
jgi:hypothetical protein